MKAVIRTLAVGLCTVVFTTASSTAFAQAFLDNFDSYTPGSIGGQGVWQGWTGNNAVAGNVTSLYSSSPSQSLQILTGNDTVRPFTGVNSGQWRLSIQQYVPTTTTGSIWTILMNKYPTGLNWSVQMLGDATSGLTGVFDGAGTQQGPAFNLLRDQWVDIHFDINLSANSVSAYYNNSFISTFAWQDGTGANSLQALDLYGDEGATTALVGPVFYDNLRLSEIPEPGSLSLLALGGLAFALRRKMR